MLSFLQNTVIQAALRSLKIDPEQLYALWDMPEPALDTVKAIYAYEEVQRLGQEQSKSQEEKFKYLRAWPLEMDSGIMLYLLVCYLKPNTILDCGTSFGVSAIFEACALQQNQKGQVITVEVSKLKHELAARNFQLAGIEKYVSQEKRAFDQYLKQVDQNFDLVFLDCDRSRYPFYFEQILPQLNPNALIVVDNAIDRALDIVSLQTKLRERGWGYVVVPVGDGILLATEVKEEK